MGDKASEIVCVWMIFILPSPKIVIVWLGIESQVRIIFLISEFLSFEDYYCIF